MVVRKVIKSIIPPLKKRSSKTGLPPGSLVYVGDKVPRGTRIRIIDYNEEKYEQKEVEDVKDIRRYKNTDTVTWINFDGVHNPELIEEVGKEFGLHPLVMEDILNTDQRAKIDDYDDYLFFVARMFYNIRGIGEVQSEQLSIVIGKGFILSFQETEGDMFDILRDRLKMNKGKVRKLGSDYLGYCLLDLMVDNYFSIIEKIGEDLETIEDELAEEPDPNTLQKIHNIKQRMIFLRKSVWPLREAISKFHRIENPLIGDETKVYLRDVYDHTIQVIDAIESYRDTTSGMIDIYLSSISYKMNEIMKVLTIISTIFIPLTFIAGVYGMNFHFMPEISWKYGYFAILGVMATVGIGMLYYFKRRNWL
ncbi:MAG: magnesium/cobalt transporter CorA [Candidatus Nanoarchaeia archaeon]